LDENNKLIATSLAENTWDASAVSLILGSASTNELVQTASAYIANNAINVENTFILQNDELNLEDMITTVHKYTDVMGLLDWKLVSVQYYDEELWLSSADSDNDDDEVVTGVAIAMGALLFVVIAAVVVLLAVGKLTFGGAKGDDTTALSKSGTQTSETL